MVTFRRWNACRPEKSWIEHRGGIAPLSATRVRAPPKRMGHLALIFTDNPPTVRFAPP